ARRALPLRLAGQPRAGPRSVATRLIPRHADHRAVVGVGAGQAPAVGGRQLGVAEEALPVTVRYRRTCNRKGSQLDIVRPERALDQWSQVIEVAAFRLDLLAQTGVRVGFEARTCRLRARGGEGVDLLGQQAEHEAAARDLDPRVHGAMAISAGV